MTQQSPSIIDLSKTYRTCDKCEVKLSHKHKESVYGYVKYNDGNLGWQHVIWNEVGKDWFGKEKHDLFEVKPKITKEFWVMHYKNNTSYMTQNKPVSPGLNCIAVTKHTVTFEEGEGL